LKEASGVLANAPCTLRKKATQSVINSMEWSCNWCKLIAGNKCKKSGDGRGNNTLLGCTKCSDGTLKKETSSDQHKLIRALKARQVATRKQSDVGEKFENALVALNLATTVTRVGPF